MDHGFDEIGWDRETDAIGLGIGLAVDRGQGRDADKLPLQIDQSSTAIAGIHGSVSLDEMGERGPT